MLQRKKETSEQGAITVEATISLTAFMFMIVTVLTIVNICVVQTKMGTAIHCAAKELSQYSYLYALTGIPESQKKLNDATAETKKTTNEVMSDINTVFTEIQNLGNTAGRADATDITGLLTDVENGVKNIGAAGSDLKDKLETLAEDPQKVAFALAKIAANDGMNLVQSRLIAAPLLVFLLFLLREKIVIDSGDTQHSVIMRVSDMATQKVNEFWEKLMSEMNLPSEVTDILSPDLSLENTDIMDIGVPSEINDGMDMDVPSELNDVLSP